MSRSLTVAIFNVKGGVGKTTTAVNLSYLAARPGDPTLLIDLDPQGAATYHHRIRAKIKGGAQRLITDGEVEGQLRGSDFENLDVLPADLSYRNLDLTLDTAKKPRQRLARLLAPLRERYRYIFVDCAPTLSLVSESVFEAADVLLVPTIPTPLSLQALVLVVKQVRRTDREPLIVPFFSMVDRRKSLHREVCDDDRGPKAGFLNSVIPYSSAIEQMAIRRSPLPATAPRHEMSVAFENLWAETLERVHTHGGGARLSKKVPKLLSQLSESTRGPVRRTTSVDAVRARRSPTMDRIENEIKLLVDDEQAFRTLGDLLLGKGVALPAPGTQVNHFFDTSDRVLGRRGFVLRLREQGACCTLTAKGPARQTEGGNGLMSKAEEEIEITAAERSCIGAGETSPLDLIEARVRGRPALLRAIREAARERRLAEVGVFRNERRSLGPVAVATAEGTARLLVEMDRTEFPGGRIDHEVEAEILEGSPDVALASFRDLFRKAGLEWRPAPSKPSRFFAAIEALSG